ncbi:MAG: serine hydrolase [Gemmatimonadaceae bacterium]
MFVGWIFYALGAAGVIILRRWADVPRPFRVPGYPLTPILFVLAAIAAVVRKYHRDPTQAGGDRPRRGVPGRARVLALGAGDANRDRACAVSAGRIRPACRRGVPAHCPSATIGPDARYAAVAAALQPFIEREMADKQLPAISIALVDDQKVVWARGFGFERPSDSVAATANTVYRVGSVSKLFTDLAIMQLVEQGKVSLDQPVSALLPDFHPANPFGGNVTLRELMSHRAGLVREPPVGHYFDDTSPSLSATVASLNQTSLVYAPQTHTKYSNAAIATVGAVLERVSGQPFAAYVKRAVLTPMGLEHAAFEPESALVRHLAAAQMWTYHGRIFAAPTFQLGMAPAGSMYATMPDLARFMSVLFAGGKGASGQVVSRATLDSMWTPQFVPAGTTNGYGLGFGIGVLDGTRVVRHGGAIYGFATELAALPDERLGVAVSISKDGANAVASRIATAALRMMRAARAGQPLPSPVLTQTTSMALARRAEGVYGSGDSAFAIVRRDSTLSLRRDAGGHWARLRLVSGDTLDVDDALEFSGTPMRVVDDGVLALGSATLRRHPPAPLPAEPPAAWRGLIGEYGWDHNTLYVLEKEGRLTALIEWFFEYPLAPIAADTFAFPSRGLYDGERLVFHRDASGRATDVVAAGVTFLRRKIQGEDGSVFRITPVKPVDQLRASALAATPPAESGSFLPSDLVELTKLDPTIRLDIRYATDRNFLSTPVYTQARAFLQRPAAEALVRAHHALRAKGYGLLIHDGYRPWYVTKMFWDGTPESGHVFVADPSSGSKHNRGGAVDLTMFDLKTGAPIVATGGYDEMSDRSYPDYPGGTSRQRALREILRDAMETQGFTVYEAEWWHFDWKDWKHYHIGNTRFEDLGR